MLKSIAIVIKPQSLTFDLIKCHACL